MRIKWGNVILTLMFIISCIDIVYVFTKLCWSTTSLSNYGLLTILLSLIVFYTVGEYLYEEMQ